MCWWLVLAPERILALADFNPAWSFTAVEPSAPMVEKARERVHAAGLADAVTFQTGTLDTLDDQGPFRGATAVLMMQFVPADVKAAFFKDIGRRLKPGGPLVMAHSIGDPESNEHVIHMGSWREHIQSVMPDRVDVIYANVQGTLHFVSEEVRAQMLVDAGFDEPLRFRARNLFGAWIVNKSRWSARLKF
ncbi:MAG: class I SAM-dependent methyltransferase [Rhodospirillaceae bacterium]|nr:class I SAM-dependent methyltransferase [Rhodospirillaceae bacterium]